jgi:hypothetical protein
MAGRRRAHAPIEGLRDVSTLMAALRGAAWHVTPPIVARAIGRLRSAADPVELVESRSRVASDEYVTWLCVVVGGWLSPASGNLAAFDHAIRHMPPGGAVVEIGSFLGLSTNILAYLLIKYARPHPFFTAEPWMFEGVERRFSDYFDAGTDAYRRYAKEIFKLNAALFSPGRMPFTIEATSDGFFDLWKAGAEAQDVFGRPTRLGGGISFAYIDGAHAYDAVRADFFHVDRELLPGGYVLLDDTSDDSPFESRHIVSAIRQDPAYELVFKTPHYFFRKR